MSGALTKPDNELVAVGPSAPAFKWSEPRERAAYLLAEDALTDTEIAREVGISRETLNQWKRRAEFQERMSEHIAKLGLALLDQGIARKRNRIARLQRIVDRIEHVIEARAASAEIDEEASGMVASKPIFSALGDLEREYKFDAALVREYRATLEQAAKELGQLTEKVEVAQETIVRRYIGVSIEDV